MGAKGWNRVEGWKEEEEDEATNPRIIIVMGGKSEQEIEAQKRKEEEEGEVMIFVDGAKKEKGGVGIWRKGGVEKKMRMGSKMEIVDIEGVAIECGIREGIKQCRREGERRIRIQSDRPHAIMLCGDHTTPGTITKRIRSAIRVAIEQNIEVYVEWTKAHVKIKGNQEADHLSKEASKEVGPAAKEAVTSIGYIKNQLKQRAKQEWNQAFDRVPLCRKGKNYSGNPETARKWRFPNNDRIRQIINCQLRTGHIATGNYLFTIGKRATAECWCGNEKQNIKHILMKCRLLRDERRKIRNETGWENITLEWLLYDQEGAGRAEELWKAFEEKRRGLEEIVDEEEEVEERARDGGRGDMGREANNEENLAERGYGE